jgi:DNA/RNA-binding domain of Phe-tRNA-synthetase-like protein
MDRLPFDVHFEMSGWELYWALLERQPAPPDLLAAAARNVVMRVRGEMLLEGLSAHPTVAALRRLFHAAGCDPTRYRPSSEALLRRLLKGEALPLIDPLVDLNNCLSASLGVPCCVMAEQELDPPFVFRPGRPGESYDSLRGPFNLEGKPLLVDRRGPCDTPITGGQRVKVRAETVRAWLVAYLPSGIIGADSAERHLRELLGAAQVARIETSGAAQGGNSRES